MGPVAIFFILLLAGLILLGVIILIGCLLMELFHRSGPESLDPRD